MQTDDLFQGTAGPSDPDVPPLEQLETMLRSLPTRALEQADLGAEGSARSGSQLVPARFTGVQMIP
jgi:hypothetical protein